MLNAEDFANEIIETVLGCDNHLIVHTLYGIAMTAYLTANLELNGGIYVGTIPGTPPVPDPLSGSTVNLDCLIAPVVGDAFLLPASASLPSWTASIGLSLVTTVMNPVAGAITLTPPPTGFVIDTLIPVLEGSTFEEFTLDLTTKLIIKLKNFSGFMPYPAVSAGGGVGTVDFSGGGFE